jgi:hypothetical protein
VHYYYYYCQNCDFATEDGGDLLPIQDLHMRVEPGEPIPAGECPECGALCAVEHENLPTEHPGVVAARDALRWALSQLEDDLDPEFTAQFDAARTVLARIGG